MVVCTYIAQYICRLLLNPMYFKKGHQVRRALKSSRMRAFQYFIPMPIPLCGAVTALAVYRSGVPLAGECGIGFSF